MTQFYVNVKSWPSSLEKMAMAEAVDVPKIVVVPHERSIHFNKRECTLSEPQKVGRSVDKKRILQNNLIFDCRVLSRNHALIWFENGKFFIKDTKSSNGTFVNETRLSSSGEESAPRELRSKDIVQFGVNVNVDKKAHGCIIARVRLFINDVELPGVEPPVQQVLQIIQNALAREQELETKLASMQAAIEGARQLATESMVAIVKEDELLSRLEMLENQLQVYAKNSSEDELKKQLAKVYEDKQQSDQQSKNSMRNILQEKLECLSKVTQLQRDYDKAEQECQKYKTLYDTVKLEHTQDVAKLSDQLKQTEEERKALQEKLIGEKETLAADLDHLKSDIKYKEEQLVKAKQRLEETEDELVNLKIAMETDKQRRAAAAQSKEYINPLQKIEERAQLPEILTEEEATLPPQPGDINTLSEPGLQSLSSSDEKPMARRNTLVSPDSLVQQLESRRREWEAKVKDLEKELEESEKTVRNLQTQLAGYVKEKAAQKEVAVQELARQMANSAISKGQLQLLHSALEKAQERAQSLQEELSSECSSRSLLQRKLEEIQVELNERQKSIETREREIKSITTAVERKDKTGESLISSSESPLKEEVTRLRDKYTKQLKEAVRVKTENTELVREMESLKLQLDESKRKREDSTGPLQKRVKLLTIIALVSIGVALASWLT